MHCSLRSRRLGGLVLALSLPSVGCTGSISDFGAGAGSAGNAAGQASVGSTSGAAAGSSSAPGAGGAASATAGGGAAGGTSVGASSGMGAVATAGAQSSGNAGSGNATGTAGAAGTAVDPAATACAASSNALNAGLTPVRRLARHEFNNTVRDLLGATGTPADALADDEQVGPFYSNAIAPIDELLVQQHSELAATLATAAKARMKTLSPCDLAAETGTTTTCATRFVTAFGQRAYRRPLTQAEITKYVSLYSLGRQAAEGAANGFRLVVETMLQSPYFLYHYDVGAKGTAQTGTVPVTAWELASRLSYFLWNSMPDDALFALAQDGTLTADATISAQVTRLLADPRAASTIAMFHRQWLGLTDLAAQPKDATLYAQFTPALADAMLNETALFTDAVIRQGDGLLKTLLTSNLAYPQGALFGVYGVTQPAGYQPGTAVALDASKRAGILTQAAFLSRWAHANQTSPVHRGKLIRLNVLCGTVPPPPENANTTPPPPTAITSTRQRFAQHVADPTCAGCHQLMDPIGLGFENYDSIGAYRTMDGLGAVDATGNVVAAAADVTGPFDGAVELAHKLAASSDVANCFANQWFRFSLGRMESSNDACSIQSIHDAFRASGGNIRELMARLALSPSFRNVRLTPGG